MLVCVFFFNDTATTEIYTLSLHDALPILVRLARHGGRGAEPRARARQRLHRRAERAGPRALHAAGLAPRGADRKSTRLNSSHANISYAVFCLEKKSSVLHTVHPVPEGGRG